MREFAILLSILLLGIGCRGTGKIMPVKVEGFLESSGGIELNGEVVDICADGSKVLMLDGSGARVLGYDSGFAIVETIPLSIRLVGPRGIYADRYYIYVYDDKTLYRLAKDKLLMSAWLNNVRVEGLAGFSPGEVLVSDGERQMVWLKSLFGESRAFLDRTEIKSPKAMAVFPEGIFGILAERNRLVKVNRAGIITESLTLPMEVNLLAADSKGRAMVMRRGEPVLFVIADKTIQGYELQGTLNPQALAVIGNRLVILDGARRILFYLLPGK
ncbi:MAG: hypothetical protein ABIK47_04930 [candidate division WOR-3 bacterium]